MITTPGVDAYFFVWGSVSANPTGSLSFTDAHGNNTVLTDCFKFFGTGTPSIIFGGTKKTPS